MTDMSILLLALVVLEGVSIMRFENRFEAYRRATSDWRRDIERQLYELKAQRDQANKCAACGHHAVQVHR